MAVLDLETGEVVKDRADMPVVGQPVQPAQTTPAPAQRGMSGGQIINLNTGQPLSAEPPAAQPSEQVATPATGFPGAGFLEPAATVFTGAIAEPISGLAGIGALPFGGAEGGAETVEAVRDALTFEPRTEKGQQALQGLGEFLAPVTERLQALQSGLGELGFQLAGPIGGATAETLPAAIMEALGLKGIRQAQRVTPQNVVVQQLSQEEELAARAARESAEKTGVGLFKAQQTLNPTDIERQAFLAQLPSSSAVARGRLLNQNKQAYQAVDDFLQSLAPPESVTSAAPKFRSAADAAIEKQKKIREEATSPIYIEAFEQGADVDLQPLRQYIDAELADLPEGGEIARSLNKVTKLIEGKTKVVDGQEVVQRPTLKQLHNAKIEIDQMLDKVGTDSLGNTTKRKLTEAKDLLVGNMAEASKLYENARAEFERLSPNVDKLRDSIIGRLAGFDDIQLKSTARQLFDPEEANSRSIQLAKQAIEGVDPDAWAAITRSELERRLGNVRADIGDLSSPTAQENIPGQLFTQLFGNKKKRDILFNALNSEQRKNAAYLERALRRATVGRPGGSQTGIRQEVRRELQQGVIPAIRDFFRAPVDTTAGIGAETSFNRRSRALADVLFDPTWKEEITKIRELPVTSTRAQQRMQILLNSALITTPATAGAVGEVVEQSQQQQQ